MENKDQEKIMNFTDMVEASRKMNKPWIIFCGLLLAALILSNALWAYVHAKQLEYAYMTPTEYSQSQDFDGHTQEQQYSQGTAQGK